MCTGSGATVQVVIFGFTLNRTLRTVLASVLVVAICFIANEARKLVPMSTSNLFRDVNVRDVAGS